MLKEISIKEAQDTSFKLFLAFDKICKEYKLTYYLSGGTLLGAIRHKGFIPWDDDMDVMMPRPDYERLVSLNLNLPPDVELVSCERFDDYFMPFAKICDKKTKLSFPHHIEEKSLGIFVDIFPIEGLPEARFAQKIYFMKMKIFNILRNSALRKNFIPDEKHVWIKRHFLMPYAKRKGAHYYAKRMNSYAAKWKFGNSKYAGVTMITHYGERELMNYKVFSGKELVEFNGVQSFAPIGWDEYLRNLYGDYMKLPPINERITDHSNFVVEIREEKEH